MTRAPSKPKSKRWFTYVVRCADGSLYTGATNDLARRLAAHNAGKGARYTRSRGPVELVWSQRKADKSRALSLEARIKQLTRAEKEALITSGGAAAAARRSRSTRRGRPSR